jgi:hypothetical protein
VFIREKAGAGFGYVVGYVIAGSGSLLLALTGIEAVFGSRIRGLTQLVGHQFPLFGWVLWLPTDTGTDAVAVLLSTPAILAVCLMALGGRIICSSRKSFIILGKASERRRLRELLGDDASYHQSIGNIIGNGEVNINQTADLRRRKELQRAPSWKRPVNVGLGILVVVIGAWITKSIGLTP